MGRKSFWVAFPWKLEVLATPKGGCKKFRPLNGGGGVTQFFLPCSDTRVAATAPGHSNLQEVLILFIQIQTLGLIIY